MSQKSNLADLLTKGVVCLALSAAVIGVGEFAQATVYKPLEAPTPANENGVITAEEWSEVFPEIYASYMENEENNYRTDYLEEDPYLTTIYEGFGFAKDYTSAIGHTYTLEDVYNTERPHALANCLTCKTPDYTKLVNDMGVDAYTLDFEETYAQMNESVSCYNCHANEALNDGELVVTHSYVTEALGEDHGIALETLTCGQCHIEYYFDPETKATSMPYDSVAAMDPEEILAYYNEMGYSDWTQESTGTGLLKAQHPELETVLGTGSMHTTLSCADCHMADEGDYTSHNWQSPLASEAILETCASCHGDTDMTAKVEAIQEEITGREKEVGEKLAALKTALADAVASCTYEEAALDEIRQNYREAQWYWDFCYVENSEGAHNSTLARRCLNNSEALIDNAMEMFTAAPAEAGEAAAEVEETEIEEAATETEEVVTEAEETEAAAEAVAASAEITPANENGVITAEEWGEVYPEIYESYMANNDNNYRTDYLEQDPYLTTVYEGFGFAKDYTSAIGHTYTLEDVYNTERPHALANCLTCKTPDYTKLVNDMGVDAYTLDFAETYEQMNESVSCYNCHANEAGNDGELVVTHSYVTEALGENNNIALETLTCGQCHIEYYFDPETKATSMPYDSVSAMDPEEILAYYNEMGYSDWTQESTGTGLLKAQHPELETVLGTGSKHTMLSCADCHMADEGDYTSHTWESPLASEAILETCASCHGDTDMTAKVEAIQEEITGREKEVGEKLAALKTALADAVASGTYEEAALDEIRQNYREAQWYWDFCYVENSEGAHNSTLAKKCLDSSEALIDEAMGMFEA